MLTNEKGSTLVEMCWSTVIITSLISGTLIIAYMCLAKVWLSHLTYEASVCLAAKGTKPHCEGRLRLQIKDGLPVGRLLNISSVITESFIKVEAHFQLTEKQALRSRHEIKLPLKGALP